MYPKFTVGCIMETNSLQKTLEALRLSFNSSSNSAVQQATHTLAELSKHPGYLPDLVQIVNQQPDELLIYAALAQLKNQLRERWRVTSGKDALPSADKAYFLERLVQMNVRMMGNQGYFKLLKDLVVIVAESAICLLPQVLQMLENGHHLKACLNILLGISEFYRFQSAMQDKNTFLMSLQKILPCVLGLVHKGQQHLISLYQQIQQLPSQQLVDIYNHQKELFQEILYMSIKLVYKCISSFLPLNLLPFLIEWAAIAIGRLAEENEDHDRYASSHPFQSGSRGTDMFNYFHGKKWSAKFMVKFIEKVLISKKSAQEISSISQEFYHSRGREVECTVVELLKRPKPNSVRFYEIYLIDMIFQKRPQLLEKHARLFLFEILPPFFLPSQGEMHDLQNNPADFFFSETYQGHQTKNVKLIATALWIQLAFSDSSEKIEGALLLDSLQHINDWLYDECLQAKQIAVYLLSHMTFKMSGIQTAKEKVSRLLEICIPAIFEQPNLLLQVRGFELIKAYPLLLQKSILDPLIKMVLNIFRESLSGQKNVTLAIYGGMALEKLIFYGGRVGLRLCDSDVRTILNVLLQLIKSEKLDQLSQTLLTLAEAYPQEISIHSVDLANHLFSTFHGALDRAQMGEGHNHYQHIQSILNILHELMRIVNTSNHQEIPLLPALEEGVASSIQSLFLRQSQKIISQYIEGLLKLLSSLINAQTNKRNELSSRLSFPFILLIANLSPLQTTALQALQTSPLTCLQKHILARQNLSLGLETQITFQLLRNYLKFLGSDPSSIKIMKQDELSRQFFSTNLLNQFMNMVYYYFRIPHGEISPQQMSEICRGRYLSTHLLTSLLENHQQLPPTLLKKIMQIMIINLKSEKLRMQLVKCNFMLFCVWMAKVPNPFEPLEESLNTPPSKIALRFIIPAGQNMLYELRTPQERCRVILAFARIIELSITSLTLRVLLHFAFTWELYLLDLNFIRSAQDQDIEMAEQCEPPSYELQYEIDQQCGDYTRMEEPNEFLVAMRAFKKVKDHDPQLFREHALNGNYYSFRKLYELGRLGQDAEFSELLDEQ